MASFTRKRLILNGYYGFDNFGDELILLSLARVLQRYGYAITVLSCSPDVTRQRYGVGAIHRYNPFQLIMTFLRGQALISGGGGLMQDSTGPNSVIYYGIMMIFSKILGLRVMHTFTSVGPIEGKFTRKFAGFALKFCDFIMVRDEQSANEVESMTGVRPMVTADAVWLLPPFEGKKSVNPMRESSTPAKPWKVAMSLRPHSRFPEEQQAALVTHMADVLSRSLSHLKVELSLVSCEDDMDFPVLQRFREGLLQTLSASAQENLSITYAKQNEALKVFAEAHWVVGMRYHALVASLLNNTEVFALDYDPKVRMLAKDLDLPCIAVDALSHASGETFVHGLQSYSAPNLTPLKQAVDTGFRAIQVVLESEHKRSNETIEMPVDAPILQHDPSPASEEKKEEVLQ